MDISEETTQLSQKSREETESKQASADLEASFLLAGFKVLEDATHTHTHTAVREKQVIVLNGYELLHLHYD